MSGCGKADFEKCAKERIFEAVPACAPTRPPNGSILRVAGWGSGPVRQNVRQHILQATLYPAG